MNKLLNIQEKEFTIPEGTQDLVLGQCFLKRQLQLDIEELLDRWGYTEIITPTIEYYETYHNGFGNVEDEKMFRFFNREGKILTLRMDMTIPIARVMATKFKNSKPPFRFRYCANVFKIQDSLSGKRSELTDCGVELIGLNSEESDLEILCCAIEVIEKLNSPSYTLEIGDTNFFRVACEKLNLQNEVKENLAHFINNKRLNELNEYVSSLNLEKEYKKFFRKLPLMCGPKEILREAKEYCFSEELIKIINSLEKKADDLEKLGYENNITFDLGKVPRLNYYTGLIFEAYIKDVGVAVLSGGRYDKLIGKFGKNLPAIGFSVKLDYVLKVMNINKKFCRYIIRYPVEKKVEALIEAKKLREKAVVQLYPYEGMDIDIERRNI